MDSLTTTTSGTNVYTNKCNCDCMLEDDNARTICYSVTFGFPTFIGWVVGETLSTAGIGAQGSCISTSAAYGTLSGFGLGCVAATGAMTYLEAKYGGCCGLKSRKAAPVHTNPPISNSRTVQQPEEREPILTVQPLPMHNDSNQIESDQALTVISSEPELQAPPPSYETVMSSADSEPTPPSYGKVLPS